VGDGQLNELKQYMLKSLAEHQTVTVTSLNQALTEHERSLSAQMEQLMAAIARLEVEAKELRQRLIKLEGAQPVPQPLPTKCRPYFHSPEYLAHDSSCSWSDNQVKLKVVAPGRLPERVKLYPFGQLPIRLSFYPASDFRYTTHSGATGTVVGRWWTDDDQTYIWFEPIELGDGLRLSLEELETPFTLELLGDGSAMADLLVVP